MPSSVIASFRYFANETLLRVIFVSGKIYDYLNVPEDIYNEMRSSGSKGTYLNENIKGKYPYLKIN